MPRLIDGREVASASPEWRQETLARHVLSFESLDERRAWLDAFERRNGLSAADELKACMRTVFHARKATTPQWVLPRPQEAAGISAPAETLVAGPR
jgi:hypothetical protein